MDHEAMKTRSRTCKVHQLGPFSIAFRRTSVPKDAARKILSSLDVVSIDVQDLHNTGEGPTNMSEGR
jgi:hypothetical protein